MPFLAADDLGDGGGDGGGKTGAMSGGEQNSGN